MQQPQVANTSDGFFDIVFDEVSTALVEGTAFAPDAIARTFGAGHGRAADRFLDSVSVRERSARSQSARS